MLSLNVYYRKLIIMQEKVFYDVIHDEEKRNDKCRIKVL